VLNDLGELPMIKIAAGALVTGLVFSTPLMAQQAPIWQGVYLGADLGGQTRNAELIVVRTGSSQKTSHNPGAGGVFAGYNWQFGSWVAGVEGDITRGGGNTGTLPTLRGRVGWAFDNTLLYVTAGAGLQGATVTRTATGQKIGHTFLGPVVGGGVETKLARNWGLRGEVMYFNAGKEQYDFPASGAFGPKSDTLSLQNFFYRVGLSYQFN
jgi:outer membrane immunogenic protein